MLELVSDNNIVPMRNGTLPYMWGFGGKNVYIEMDKIESVECVYYHDFGTDNYIPNLRFTLKGGITVTVDYDKVSEAHEALMYYRRKLNNDEKADN